MNDKTCVFVGWPKQVVWTQPNPNYSGSDCPKEKNMERHPQWTTGTVQFLGRKHLGPVSLITHCVCVVHLHQAIGLTILTVRRETVKQLDHYGEVILSIRVSTVLTSNYPCHNYQNKNKNKTQTLHQHICERPVCKWHMLRPRRACNVTQLAFCVIGICKHMLANVAY